MKFILLFLFLSACAYSPILKSSVPMKDIYKNWVEIGYCLHTDGSVSNIHKGGWMTSPLPLCNHSETVMHTHPVWAENAANFFDISIFNKYKEIYGNDLFGVQFSKEEYRVYKLQ